MRKTIAVALLAALAAPASAFTMWDQLFFPWLQEDTAYSCREEVKAATVDDSPSLNWIGAPIQITFGVPTPSTVVIKAGGQTFDFAFHSQNGFEVINYINREETINVSNIKIATGNVVYVFIGSQKWRCEKS